MKLRWLLPSLLFALAPLRLAAAPAEGGEEFFPLSEVKPGLKGYGLTVFRGTTIERFEVEAIGVLPNADLDGDWIMVRITTGPVPERRSGVIAGMSGSPVYFDGKLAGAVAYGFAFPVEPVCFLTPIENMLRVLDDVDDPPTRAARADTPQVVALPEPVVVNGSRRTKVMVSQRPLPDGWQPPADVLPAEPLATPVMIAGLSETGMSALSKVLEPYRMVAVPGPGGATIDVKTDLQPGSAMGVGLVTGDVSMTAIGTVTYRRGDRVLGFGHPMMQRNSIALPLTGGYVVDFFSGLQRSFKLAAPLATVGTLRQDGHWGVAGELGDAPPMVPFTLELRDRDRDRSRVIECEVVEDEVLTPGLLMGVATDTLATWVGSLPKTMITTTTRVELSDGLAPIERREVGLVEGQAQPVALADLSASLQVLSGNPFQNLHPKRVHLTIDIQRQDDTATISRLFVDRTTVEPGDTIGVEIELRRKRDGQLTRRHLDVIVPEDAVAGKTRLGIGGGAAEPMLLQQLKSLSPPPESVVQLLDRFAETDTDNRTLVARLALPRSEMGLGGVRLPTPPTRFMELLAQGNITDLATGQTTVRVEEPADLVITNAAFASVTITTPGAPPAAQPAQPSGGEGARAQAASVALLPPMATTQTPEALLARLWPSSDADTLGATPVPARPANGAGSSESGQGGGSSSTTVTPTATQGSGASSSGGDKGATTRGPRVWLQTSAKDFAAGEHQGTAPLTDDSLALAMGRRSVGRTDEPLLFAAAVDGEGRVWAGSANDGLLVRFAPDGASEVVVDTDQPMVTAVAAMPDGIWFATAPDGALRRWAGGQATVVARSGAAYVWRLRPARDGSLLAVTGVPAKVLRIRDSQVEPLHEADAEHLLALAEGPDGAVYAAGGSPGVVLRVRGNQADTLLTTKEPVHALAVTETGQVVFADEASVAVIEPNGRYRSLGGLDGNSLYDLEATPQGVLAAAGGKAVPAKGSVWSIDLATGTRRRAFEADALAVVDLQPTADGVVAVTGAPALAYRLAAPFGESGTFTSTVLDAGDTAGWGAVQVQTAPDQSGELVVQTRSGNSPDPDRDWGPWLDVTQRVQSAPARYLQYRLTLRAAEGQSPKVEHVRVLYHLVNAAPTVTLEAPAVGEAWKGKQSVKWKVSDPNGDQPLVSLYLEPVPSGAEGAAGERQELAAELPAADAKHEVDTSKLADGRYRLRVVADDGVYNPDDPKQAETLSDIFLIDNTAPEAGLPELTRTDGRVTLSLMIRDNLLLKSAEWRLDGGNWYPAVPEDGLFDTDIEPVRLRTPQIKPGKHTLELRVRDAAGNETVAKREFEVAAEAGGGR